MVRNYLLIFFYANDMDCKYHDFDENLTKALEHKNDLTLSIISLNICSVPKHLEEFKLDFGVFGLDIIAFTETRLTPEVESLYKMLNYDMHCNSRNAQVEE